MDFFSSVLEGFSWSFSLARRVVHRLKMFETFRPIMEGNVTNKEDTQKNQNALMFFTIAVVVFSLWLMGVFG